MTPAETLSNAARLMRERPEPWVAAVADWLDVEAAIVARRLPDESGASHPALRVARAYLASGDAP